MDAVISAVRFPLACIASSVVIVGHLVVFIADTVLVLISFPFAAVFMSRDDLKDNWIGKYPNVIRNGIGGEIAGLGEMLTTIWNWIQCG